MPTMLFNDAAPRYCNRAAAPLRWLVHPSMPCGARDRTIYGTTVSIRLLSASGGGISLHTERVEQLQKGCCPS